MKAPMGKVMTSSRGDRGFVVLLLVATIAVLFCGLAGLALDVGRAYLARAELQKAADAAALAGAGNLYPSVNLSGAAWTTADTQARAFVGNNKADGAPLDAGNIANVQTGYWNLSGPSTQELGSTSTVPGVCTPSNVPCTLDADCLPAFTNGCFWVNVPAVRITLKKDTPAMFAKLSGWSDFHPSATAVAVAAKSGPPIAMPPGTVFPFAVMQQFVDQYVSGANPGGNITLNLTSGQWCGLGGAGPVSAAVLNNYVTYITNPSGGTPPPTVTAGDPTNFPPPAANMSSVYGNTLLLITAGKGLVYLPVVDNAMTPVIRSFARVQLTGMPTASSITARFVFQKLVR
jgi:Flp pilus assembly protein TadG